MEEGEKNTCDALRGEEAVQIWEVGLCKKNHLKKKNIQGKNGKGNGYSFSFTK